MRCKTAAARLRKFANEVGRMYSELEPEASDLVADIADRMRDVAEALDEWDVENGDEEDARDGH